MDEGKKKALFVLALPIVGLMGLGFLKLAEGIFLGSLVVAGLMMTIEQAFGKIWWPMATSKVGMPVVAIGTAWLCHIILPGGHVSTTIAIGWALLAKAVILLKMRESLQSAS